MGKFIRKALVVVLILGITLGGLVVFRLNTIEDRLDLQLSFGVPGSTPDPDTIRVDGEVIARETTGWELSYNGEKVLEPAAVLTWDNLVDAGELAEDWPPPGEEFVARVLRNAFGYEGRAFLNDWKTWAFFGRTRCLWLLPVYWLHSGDLLDPMLVCLARHPGSGRLRVGLLRLSRDGPAAITGWSGTGDIDEVTDATEAVLTGIRHHRATWTFGLSADQLTMEKAGFLTPNYAIRQSGAKGWYEPPTEEDAKAKAEQE